MTIGQNRFSIVHLGILTLLTASLLSGCGGGGSGSAAPATGADEAQREAPQQEESPDEVVDEEVPEETDDGPRSVIFVGNNWEGVIDVIDAASYQRLGRISGIPDQQEREKAIALTIPQFAAASAHYHSASPLAPRLIMLDEAFVGVDPDMRSKCMGLLAEFDLDLVMTSESEWGCYPGLDGNAIYQLATRQGMDGVPCTRWVWLGQCKTQDTATDRPHDSAEPQANDSGPLYEGADTP